jgi:hypothetical protein
MSPLLSLEEIKKSMLIKISERSYRIKRWKMLLF